MSFEAKFKGKIKSKLNLDNKSLKKAIDDFNAAGSNVVARLYYDSSTGRFWTNYYESRHIREHYTSKSVWNLVVGLYGEQVELDEADVIDQIAMYMYEDTLYRDSV